MSDHKLQDITDSPFAAPVEPRTSGPTRKPEPEPEEEVEIVVDRTGSRFRLALAAVERHRHRVRTTLAIAMLARLVCEFRLDQLGRSPAALVAAIPAMGLALLSYMIVLWFLAARTRDRFGFGMALGIAVLEGTYALGAAAVTRPFSVAATWPMLAIGIAHLPMAYAAFRASSAFPPYDSKKPWIVGFVAALLFLAVPWIAPTAMELVGKLH